MSEARETLVYDGDCGICRYWVSYWERQTGGRVVYRPYQEAAADFPTISLAAFERAIQLIEPGGRSMPEQRRPIASCVTYLDAGVGGGCTNIFLASLQRASVPMHSLRAAETC